MNIIILGSNNVGSELARYLVASGHAVTLVDNDPTQLEQLSNKVDLMTITGNPSSPAILRTAGAENAELLVATTSDDEANITACSVGGFLFHIPRKIARIRSVEYLAEQSLLFGPHGIPIDHIISPEKLVTENIIDLIDLPGASAVAPMCANRLLVICVRCAVGGKLIGKSIAEFASYDSKAAVLAVYREGRRLQGDNELFRPGDEVFFCCERSRALSQMSALIPLKTGHRNITIAGGTHVADELARQLSSRYNVKLIESDEERSKRLEERLHDTPVQVFNSDPVSLEFIYEENIHKTSLFIAATPADHVNIMSSMLVGRQPRGDRKDQVYTVAVIRGEGYGQLTMIKDSGINALVFPTESTVSALLGQIRQESVENVRLLRHGKSEVLELRVLGGKRSSAVAGSKISSLSLPEGVRLGLIIREGDLLEIGADTTLEPNDRVIAYLDDHKQTKQIVKLFRPKPFWMPKW